MASIVRSARDTDNVPVVVWVNVADNQTIKAGDLVQINGTSRKAEAAVAASTTIIGIAQQGITTGTATAADKIPVAKVRGQVVRMAVDQTGTKKTFADTDKYTTAYNLKDKVSVNPDSTTGGMCCVQGYDNTQKTVDVIFTDASLVNIG